MKKDLKCVLFKTKSNVYNKNGIYKIECPDYNKFYVDQTKKRLVDRYLEHRKAFLKLHLYKSNLVTHCLNNKYKFTDIKNVKLIESIQKGHKMNIWENLNIYTHNNLSLIHI